MATLLRAFARQRHIISARVPNNLNKITSCHISITNKKKAVADATQKSVATKSEELKQLEEGFADGDPSKEKNWISYGFDFVDRDKDRFFNNVTFFSFITASCLAFYIFAYLPDYKLNDWAVREAFLEIDRREREGLPLVDPNLVPPEMIDLPSETDLMDKEVII